MLHMTGECLGVTEERRGNPGSEFLVREVHVLDGVYVHRANLGRDFRGDLPDKGEFVALDIVVSAYVSKRGNSGTQITALRRNLHLEEAATLAAAAS